MLLLFFVTLSLFSQSRFPTYFQAFVVVFEGFFSSSSSRQLGGNGGESADNNMRATIALLEGGPLTQTIRSEARHSPYTKKFFLLKIKIETLVLCLKNIKNCLKHDADTTSNPIPLPCLSIFFPSSFPP